MSVEAVKWAMYDAPHLATGKGKPDASARQVLSVLAEHADKYGTDSYPTPPRIRYATGLALRTIDDALKRLERAGLIVRDGVVYTGAIRWKLNMSMVRPEAEWHLLLAQIEEEKRGEADRVRAFRDRQASLHREERTETDDVRTQSDSVRTQFDSVGTSSVAPEPPEPPVNHPQNHPGGTLPPNPLRTAAPPAPRNDEPDTLTADQHPPLDQQGDHRPRTRAENPAQLPAPAASSAPNLCPHGQDPRRRTATGKPRCKPCRALLPTGPDTTSPPMPSTCTDPRCTGGILFDGDAPPQYCPCTPRPGRTSA